MDTAQFCMGCMRPKGASDVCPQCGYRSDANRNPMVLPYQAVLNNKFLIGRLLGEPGGFGVTYLAWDLVLHTTVAIKEYFPRVLACRSTDHTTVRLQSAQDGERYEYGLKQFLLEARTLAQFNHPNVVRVREFFRQNHTAYLVMDYYEGISLEEYVRRKGGKINEQLALNLMLPVLDGLRVVHEKGFLHRDIKPANIYLTQSGTPILLDFGAARFALSQNNQTLTVILSAGFAPFEQYISKTQHGPWIDIYACGATLYAVTTGTLPQDALSRFQKDELRPPIELLPTLTPGFSQAVMKTLDMEPKHRPQNVPELRSLLAGQQQPRLAPTAAASQIPSPAAAKPQSTVSVRCPHCKTANTVTPGMPFNQLRCYRCSKKFNEPSEKKTALSFRKWPAFAVVLVGLGIFLQNREQPAPTAAALPEQSTVVKPQHTAAETAAATTENIPQPQTSISTVRPVAEPNIADNPPQSTPFTPRVTQQSAVPQERPEPEPEPPPPPPHQGREPEPAPQFAVAACRGLPQGAACSALNGTIRGICLMVRNQLACIPGDGLGPSPPRPEGPPGGEHFFRPPPR